MGVLQELLIDLENLEPGLFFSLKGDVAQGELDALMEDKEVVETGVTLLRINGEAQEIVNTEAIGCRYSNGRSGWMFEVPVVVVQKRSGVVPQSNLSQKPSRTTP